MSIKGGGSDAKWKQTILNFHFDFWIISLIDGIGSFNIFLLLRKSFSNLYSLIISTRVGYMYDYNTQKKNYVRRKSN